MTVNTDRLRELLERSWNDEMSDLEWGHLRNQRAEFGVEVRKELPALLDALDTLHGAVAAWEDKHLTDPVQGVDS